MFKNRSILVKYVKDPKDKKTTEIPEPDTIEYDPAKVAAIATEVGEYAVKGAVIVIVTYFASDTLRQVIVNAMPKR